MKNIYYEAFELLMRKYKKISNLWNVGYDNYIRDNNINPRICKELCSKYYKEKLHEYHRAMKVNNIKMVTCLDNNYPAKLHLIKNKPIVLFYKGDINVLNNESVAIVGSRNCTDYGRKCADFFSYELAKRNVNIVSGLAIGIDSVAHIATLRCGGKTVAVIGNGLDNVYPKQNKVLADKIIENGGLIMSEFITGTPPEKNNFPRRNRIISGISNAVIVVEANHKSGSLITANFAINQGKEVWAIPGSIYSKSSCGTNQLIKDGANVLTNLSDIIRNI